MKFFIAFGAIILSGLIAAQFISVFVVPPIGAVPKGGTIIISRLSALSFIDSPDGWCERNTGSVTLLCRGMVLGKIGQEATIIARLPYSQWLYEISTGGKVYDR